MNQAKQQFQALEQSYKEFRELGNAYYDLLAHTELVEGAPRATDFIDNLIMRTKSSTLYESRFLEKLKPYANIESIIPSNNIWINTLIGRSTARKDPMQRIVVKNPGKKEAIIGLDCEMVATVSNDMALARVSAVDINGDLILDFLVKPADDISFVEDYRSHITGFERQNFEGCLISFDEALKILASKIDKDTLIIGHAIDSDLSSMKISHEKIIDSALLYPVSEISTGKTDPELTHSLAYLAETVLGASMQRDERLGIHDSIEDAAKSVELIKFLYRCHLQGYNLKPIPRRLPRKYQKNKEAFGVYKTLAYIRNQQSVSSQPKSSTSSPAPNLPSVPTVKPKSRFTESYKAYMNLLKKNSTPQSSRKNTKISQLRKKCSRLSSLNAKRNRR